jgi:plasmid stabilization system protein ParE
LKRYLLSPAATADVEGIAGFLDEHAPHATGKVLAGLRNAMVRIAAAPGTGHPREDLADEPLRFLVVWSYLVVYRHSSPIEIVRVLHASRDVAKELRRKRRPR